MTFTRSLVSTTVLATLATTIGLGAPSLSTAAIDIAQAQNGSGRSSAPTQPPTPSPLPPPPAAQPIPRHRTVWQHGDTLRQDDDWVESTFSVDEEGGRLILSVQGSVEVQSAQVQFADGQTRSLQVRNQPYGNGEYLLLDFGQMQQVQSVNLVGRTSLSKSAYSVQLLK